MSSQPLRLPLDRSTFSDLRGGGYVYVDKTQHAYNLITGGRAFFLNRPRRFGKSLFVSTLQEILNGNRALFEGLWIESSNYPWHPHGVIIFNLSSISTKNEERLEQGLCEILAETAQFYQLDIKLTGEIPETDLRRVVIALHARFGRVAVLIDEYDSPILRELQHQDHAHKLRQVLSRFFTTIKGLDAYLKFLFITGVSAFSKAGIFSGMNDLRILSLQEPYADICGYTDTEIDTYFTDYITAWAGSENIPYPEQRDLIKKWYNGYRFSTAPTTVYSPFSVMHAMEAQSLENFWFSSATPTFLVEELKKQQRKSPDAFAAILENKPMKMSQEDLAALEIGLAPVPLLMFQTGYLTIVDYQKTPPRYLLGYPNREVEQSLQLYLLSIVTKEDSTKTRNLALDLSEALIKKDVTAAMGAIRTIFTSMPYNIHGDDEGHYHAILYMALKIACLATQAEFITSHGRADVVLNLPHVVYVIEVKFADATAKTRTQTAKMLAQKALTQIEERRYYEQFIHEKKSIILLGIAFKRGEKSFEIEYESKTIND